MLTPLLEKLANYHENKILQLKYENLYKIVFKCMCTKNKTFAKFGSQMFRITDV